MNMSFDVGGIAGGFLFSVVGLWMFREARRRNHLETQICGVVMMVYPYFVDGWKLNWGIGILISFVAYTIWDRNM